MANKLINCILDALHLKENRLTLLRNSDRFFYRKEVQDELLKLGVKVFVGCTLDLRIDFELNFKTDKVKNSCYLIDCKEDLLEDMLNDGCYYDFQLITYFPEYSQEIILNCSIYELNLLFCNKPMQTLSEKQTEAYLNQYITAEISDKNYIKKNIFSGLKSIANSLEINWDNTILPISMLIQTAIKEELWADIIPDIKNINERFQKHLEDNYRSHIVPSSFVKRPRIVSNILPYFDFNFTSKDKIALVVIDGMSYWQYLILAAQLGEDVEPTNDVIYSWIPSITQLSRQAIFRGSAPVNNYKQDPTNESNLWNAYWRGKGFMDTQIRYDYGTLQEKNLANTLRLALVDVTLDDKMHNSSDYNDLYDLTQNWIENTTIVQSIHRLLSNDFVVFITTDHGNLKARALNYISSKEKLGTNKSGSRSLRHLEYSDNWLKEKFLANHPEWLPFLGQDNNTVYFKNDFAFSTNSSIVTHGGSHFLEVLIPFITLKKANK